MIPFISICIPTYKNTTSLRRLLSSIREQDYRDFEVVICDDTPNQDVRKIISDFADLPGLHYEQNSPRLGSPANWNRCLAKANGDWIKIMHHDDWFSAPDSLRRFAEAAEELDEPHLLFSGCNAFRNGDHFAFRHCPFGDDGGIQRLQDLAYHELVFANRIGCPSVTMFRNGCGLKFDESLLWLVDVDFYLTAIASASASVIKHPLINVTFSADTQITSTVEADHSLSWRETFYLCEKHGLLSQACVRARLISDAERISFAELREYQRRRDASPTRQMGSPTSIILLRISLYKLERKIFSISKIGKMWIAQFIHKAIRVYPQTLAGK